MRRNARRFILGTVAALILAAGQHASAATEKKSSEAHYLSEMIQFIEHQHISGVTREELTEAAIQGMLDVLDPFTSYIPPEQFAAFEEEYGTQEEPHEEADNLEESLEEGLQDAEAVEAAVTEAILSPGVAYIRIEAFTDAADEEFAESLAALRESGAIDSLILDLRGNLGGRIDAATNIAKHFIAKGIAFYTVDRGGIEQPTAILDGKKADFRTVVLVDGDSASASELLAGALRDRADATLIGERTYGKGSMQNVFKLSNGGGLAVTVAEYLTPDKHPIHGVGLAPDQTVVGASAQLLAGLRAATEGAIEVQQETQADGMQVNDIRLGTQVPWYTSDTGHVYVSLRTLAAMIGASVQWSEKNGGEAMVQGDGAAEAFSLKSGKLLIRDGVGYTDAESFREAFPELLWKHDEGTLTLSVK